ncbi:SAM-dependent methyltransferase [Treponema sp. OMZ 305]|uniref:SAM-dependent methyltransferase n=1 Tax=Treponema TaxID=157 RepID=UPI001BAFE73B|nr:MULTISPECIES: SAM-dependent methyltransferase [Treponema]QUY17836.1 SAM-dependent methyltransferase [Treponema vincentii]UTC57713.1 SAM-dependent methyltransferase [Treponema sp. OMZ 305]
MKRAKRVTKQVSGAAGFEAYYSVLFGDRWPALREALLQETQPVAFSVCGGKPYYLDQASIYAAQALPPVDAGCYLDMCAAPGGKTLVLVSGMGQKAQLQANELSRARRARLLTVVDEHLPPDIRTRVEVTGYDAATLPRYRQAYYDRILLDAPCSSERHVITDAKYLACWTPARIKMLAQRQWALLSAAFLLLKPGGFLVYATCALADAENDAVVQKLLKKYGTQAAVHSGTASELAIGDTKAADGSVSAIHTVTASLEPAAAHTETAGKNSASPIRSEKTLFGCRFLPDTCGGAGPLYFSLIEKVNHEEL